MPPRVTLVPLVVLDALPITVTSPFAIPILVEPLKTDLTISVSDNASPMIVVSPGKIPIETTPFSDVLFMTDPLRIEL